MAEICKKELEDFRIKIENSENQSRMGRGRTRQVDIDEEFQTMSQPQKKKLQDISGKVYLNYIADHKKKPGQSMHRRQENKQKQRRQIAPSSQKPSRPKERQHEHNMHLQKQLLNIQNRQVKIQEQEGTSHIPQKQPTKIQHSPFPPQIVKEQNPLNDEIINQCLIWKCPCGVDMFGPIQYFHHIQVDHKNQPLEAILYKQTLRKMFDNYPNFTLNDLEIIEQAQDIQYQKQIKKISLKHETYFTDNEIVPLDPSRNRGTYSDMAFSFIETLEIEGKQQKMMRQFFHYLKFFIDQNISKKHWHEEPPNDILKHSNHIISFFSSWKLHFKPFSTEDIRQLFYTLSNWMFMNHWSNDRIFYEIDQDCLKEEDQEDQEEKKQEN